MGRNTVGLLFLVLLAMGCSTEVPVLQKLAPLPEQGSCKIAVLPFINESSYAQGGAIIGQIFLSQLVATGHFEVFQEGDILELYRQLQLYPNRLPDQEQLEMLGGRLGPDLFVGGVLQTMYQRKKGNDINTELTFSLQVYDGRTGQILWTTYHRRLGSEYQQLMHLGRINSITALASRMSKEIISDWLTQGMPTCLE